MSSRFRALVAGLLVTTVLQSSTATALMVSSFAASGLIELVPALAVMLGANIGTALIVQILSFDVSYLFPLLVLIGYAVHRRAGRTVFREAGRIAVGLGIVLLSIDLLTASIAPLESAAAVRVVAGTMTDPLVAIVLAGVVTWVAHSSVAAVLLIMSFAGAGVISLETVIALAVGANIGSAVNPVIESRSGDASSLRVPLGNLANRLFGAVLVVPLIPGISAWLSQAGLDSGPAVVAFHLAFNIVLALLFVLPLPVIARGLVRFLPRRAAPEVPGSPRYLDRGALDLPAVALSNAERELLRMADYIKAMLEASSQVFLTDDREEVERIRRMDDAVDRLYVAVQRYLAAISRNALDEKEASRVAELLSFAVNMEHIGDIVDKNLMDLARKRMDKRYALPRATLAGIHDMHSRLLEHFDLAVSVFMNHDLDSARRVVEGKEQFRDFERSARDRQLDELRDDSPQSIEAATIQLDVVRDLKRIEAHIAATVYPLLEATGDLRQSRLAPQ